MNLSHLYYFKKLAEVQHYTRASKELFIAQPTLSAAIAQLEKELGAPLFQKRTRAVRLTTYGQDFYRYVSLALQNLEKGIDLVEQRAGKRRSTVRVGAVYSIQDKHWSRTIKAFRDSRPTAVTVEIRQDRSPALLDALHQGVLDVAFTEEPSEDPTVRSLPYRSFDLIVAVNKLHPLASSASVALEQLRPYRLLSYGDRSSLHKPLEELFETHGLSPDTSYSDGLTMCALASTDVQRVALVVESFVLKSFDNLVKVRIQNLPRGFLQSYLCVKEDRETPEVVKAFVEFFVHQGAEAKAAASSLTAEAAASFRG